MANDTIRGNANACQMLKGTLFSGGVLSGHLEEKGVLQGVIRPGDGSGINPYDIATDDDIDEMISNIFN